MNVMTKGLMVMLLTSSSAMALAAETSTFTYDAKGRLTKVVKTGSVNNGVTVEVAHDKANNRTKIKVTGAPQ